MVLEVPGDFFVQSDTLGSDPVFGEYRVAVLESPDEFFRFSGFDRGCVDVIGIIVIHDKQVSVSPG